VTDIQPTDATDAATLDDATLRRVFAGCPADLVVPSDIGELFAARMRRLGGERRTLMLVGWAGVLVIGVLLAIAGSVGPGVTLIVVGLVVAGIVVWQQRSKAADDFFDAYASARGLMHTEGGVISAAVPLFSRGDRREFSRVLSGSIAGQDARLGLYTYTEISRDSDGDETRTDYDFTVLRFDLPPAVAQRFVGVYLSPKQLSFGALQDKLAHDRKVELESIEFAKRYSLRVVDAQDDIALYELFSTTFVHQLATTLQVYWEQRAGEIVFWKKGHHSSAADLDRMCLESWHVLHRYLEEFR
jgi:hypothetical protein